jgi:hypothetical protein
VTSQHGSTHVYLVDEDDATSWWARYRAVLDGKIGSTSLGVLADDADFIVQRCVLAPDLGHGAHAWSDSRERSGAVMGAVQSGKTASMLAVIAKAIDGGVNGVVVLGGTRTSLWLQTWERLRAQLDTFPDRPSRRLMLPAGDPQHVAAGSFSLATGYSMTDQLAARALARKMPIIAVVLKQVDHLQRLAATLHEVVYPQVHKTGRPFHLLVVDDEADDSSIGENDLDDASTLQEKQVPRRIVDLWESRQRPGETALPEVRATYLAYTATPQANFLQDPSNPLAPRDFVVCLRTPGATGDPANRAPSYRVPEGLPGWYTGGDVYYRTLDSVPLCVAIDDLAEEDRLLHGVRGYLVACAIRRARAADSLGPVRSAGRVFATRQDAADAGGPVMSMLVHPSATKDAHFETAGRLLAWSAGLPAEEGQRLLADDERLLRAPGVLADMDSRPELWQEWLANFDRSLRVVNGLPGAHLPNVELGWDELRNTIIEEVLPATAVAVINSDERADDRPVFEPVRDGDGWQTAPNLCTIFVSGNVMSRGLTLEGLSTTVFTRSSEDPASDTQMQMQRWFGYRGPYIDVCRVLMTSSQIALFSQYHETDLALRGQILAAMSADEPASPAVLQGRTFKATGKIRNASGAVLWPGPEPFMTALNDPLADLQNQEVVAEVFQEASSGVPDSSGRQGRLLDRSLSLTEAADFLDAFRYPGGTAGGKDLKLATSWAAVERMAGIGDGDPLSPIFRMPTDTDPSAWGSESPFNVAAYLRFWALCLEERLPAAFTTDEPPQLWSLVDLAARIAQQPRFRVGLRFGAGDPVESGPLARMPWPVHPMKRAVSDGRLEGRWGSRNYRDGVLWGDEFFDFYSTGQLPQLTFSRARQRGSDGLILVHVIERDDGLSLAPAVSLPVGGPDQVHVRRSKVSGV